jgi:small subunit ribosomal protein S1
MVAKNIDQRFTEEASELDEGWWASILADEVTQSETAKEAVQKPAAHPAAPKVNWEQVRALYDHDEIVVMQVQGYNRGGLLVQGIGIQGFVPVSHLVKMPGGLDEEKRRLILADYVGLSLELKVIECEPSQERIVFSERAALAGEGRRKQLFHALKTGEMVTGTVTNVTDFGAFVDLGGVEGLIHVSELSWGRVQHPCEILHIGLEVTTLVLQVSEENARVALSLKRLQANPWETLVKRYKPGDVVPATVTTIMRFGVFARLDEGVEGLIHISSVNLPHGVRDLDKVLSSGQEIKVRILHIDAERRRLGLGLVAFE